MISPLDSIIVVSSLLILLGHTACLDNAYVDCKSLQFSLLSVRLIYLNLKLDMALMLSVISYVLAALGAPSHKMPKGPDCLCYATGTNNDKIRDNTIMNVYHPFSHHFSPSPCEISYSAERSARNDVISCNQKRGCPLLSHFLIVASLCIVFTCKKMAT